MPDPHISATQNMLYQPSCYFEQPMLVIHPVMKPCKDHELGPVRASSVDTYLGPLRLKKWLMRLLSMALPIPICAAAALFSGFRAWMSP